MHGQHNDLCRQGDERGRRGGYYDGMSNPPFPTESSTLVLDGPVGPLDVAVDLAEPDVTAQPVTAIVCHPLPPRAAACTTRS